jgi:hypothetical protein
MDEDSLSYTELERRIRALPDGPAKILNTPGWLLIPNVVGTLGMVLGLVPSLLILFLEPRVWMAYMARAGVWMAFLGYAPGFMRSMYVVAVSMWHWRIEQVAQLDHDLVQVRSLHTWLRRHPTEVVAEHLRFVQMVQMRLTAKLGFLAGGLDKLGVLPLLVALAIQLNVYAAWDKVPQWQVILGMFAAVTYLIAFIGSLMRLRLQLYEAVLAEALQRSSK